MNFAKWMDDLKKAYRSRMDTNTLPRWDRSHYKPKEGGYTRYEYLAHAIKATGETNHSLGGGVR